MKKIIAALGFVAALSACSSEPMPPLPDHPVQSKISLDVQAVTLADRSGLQMSRSLYKNNHFSPTIADQIKQWAGTRLQAVGQSGQAIVIIKDASLTEQALPKKTGMDSWLTRQQGVKYTGRAEVVVEAKAHEGFATTDAVATRSVTLPENPSPIEKQDAYYTLVTGLMKDLESNLNAGIQSHMGNFIITAPLSDAPALPVSPKTSSSLPPIAPQDQPDLSGNMQ